MAVLKKTKASDLQALCKKLVNLLKKHFKSAGHKKDRTVLETMLHAVCLENATADQADEADERLHSSFHDLNEIRVSTYSELSPVFAGLSDPDARAARVRAILQYVFEINFDFDFESLKRKTLELAEKQIQKIRFLTPFIHAYTLHSALGTHMVPVDDRMRDAAIWLGLALPGASTSDVADSLKPAILKADTATFCHYLRAFACDERFASTFSKVKAPEDGFDLDDLIDRATDLLENAHKISKVKPAKAASKPAAKAASKPAKKVPAKGGAKTATAKKKPR